MNSFINIFFMFIFIFTILFFKMPNIDNTDYLAHKFIIFILLFVYQSVLIILSKMKNGCKINPSEVFSIGVETGAIGVIGYSIFTDLSHYNLGSLESLTISDQTKYLYVTIIITLLMSFVNGFKLLLGYRPYECIKY